MSVTKIIEKVVEVVKPKRVVKPQGEKEVANEVCSNCNDSGVQCSTCSLPFVDTFGE